MSRPHKTEPQKTRKKDQRDNPWCSIEIKRAIQQRRVYNRAKRNAKTPEEKQKYGALYIEQKYLVQGMVKEGIQSYEQWTLNRDLGSEHNPRYRPWEYVTRRERRRRRRENSQEVVEEREGRQYPPDATDISDDRFNPTHAETQSEFPVANNDTMAFMSLNDYLQRVQGTLYDQNGDALADLISFRDPHVMSSRLMVEKPERDVERVIDPSLAEVVAGHLRATWAAGSGATVEAWRTQMVVVQAVARFMQECKEENWMLPVMYTSCLDLRLFALAADQELTRTGTSKAGETLEKAAEALMSCFRICAADTRTTEECTKRWGLLYLVNQFFKIYFKINKLNLCKPMVRAIEALSFKDRFSLSQLITYKYYTGRKDMFDSDFQAADATLSFAFQRCHTGSRKNKRRILIYLIPVKMLLGYLPKASLLQRYNLHEFQDLVTSVRQGNVRLLSETLARHESFFIGAGIYLILEKLKVLAFRNLFKKVFLMSGTHQIDITLFLRALQWMCVEDVDLDETECIVSNMINDGRIKGYISHAHRKVVVSKKDPFPPLSLC